MAGASCDGCCGYLPPAGFAGAFSVTVSCWLDFLGVSEPDLRDKDRVRVNDLPVFFFSQSLKEAPASTEKVADEAVVLFTPSIVVVVIPSLVSVSVMDWSLSRWQPARVMVCGPVKVIEAGSGAAVRMESWGRWTEFAPPNSMPSLVTRKTL